MSTKFSWGALKKNNLSNLGRDAWMKFTTI